MPSLDRDTATEFSTVRGDSCTFFLPDDRRSPAVIFSTERIRQNVEVTPDSLKRRQVWNYCFCGEAKPLARFRPLPDFNLEPRVSNLNGRLFGDLLCRKVEKELDLVGLRQIRASLAKLKQNRSVKVLLLLPAEEFEETHGEKWPVAKPGG